MSDAERAQAPPADEREGTEDERVIHSLNDAIRLELHYLDHVVATPFRAVRRSLGQSHRPWAESLGEMVWAMEGMARLPVKVLQAAFGEDSPPKAPRASRRHP